MTPSPTGERRSAWASRRSATRRCARSSQPNRRALDVRRLHAYGVDWRPGSLAFDIDGEVVRRLEQAPDYPVQLMIGVFDFPAKAAPGPAPLAELVITHVRGHPLG